MALPSAYWRSRGGGQCAALPPRWWSVKPMINVLRIPIGESSFVHLGFTGGTGPVRLACLRASDIRYQGFGVCAFSATRQTRSLAPYVSRTANSREWPFSFCTPWQTVKFLGSGFVSHVPQKYRSHMLRLPLEGTFLSSLCHNCSLSFSKLHYYLRY